MKVSELTRAMIFNEVNTTATRVPNFRAATQSTLTISTAATAVSLMAHWGISSGDDSPVVEFQNIRFRYSAKIRLITALPPAHSGTKEGMVRGKVNTEKCSRQQHTWLEGDYGRPCK